MIFILLIVLFIFIEFESAKITKILINSDQKNFNNDLLQSYEVVSSNLQEFLNIYRNAEDFSIDFSNSENAYTLNYQFNFSDSYLAFKSIIFY